MALRCLASDAARAMRIRTAAPVATQLMPFSMSRMYATVVDGLKYMKSHEWIKVEGDTATIGISDFAQSELGDVVFVELPTPGTTFDKGDAFGVVESVKAASDVYSPLSGEIVESNDALVDNPANVNTSPFEDGWMIKVKMSNPAELDDAMDSATYQKTCDDA